MPELREVITLKEILDKNLSLSTEEWDDLSKATKEKILKLIDPDGIVGVARKSEGRVLMSEKGREVVKNFLNLDREEYADLNPHLREKLLMKVTELAQKAGVAG